MTYWILDEAGKPKPVDDVLEWGRWLSTAKRHVADDTVNGVRVSTVFLGIDHRFGDGPPLLYETMTFGVSDEDQIQKRYCSREDALNGHRAIVESLSQASITPAILPTQGARP